MIYQLLHLQTSAVSTVGHFQNKSWQQSFFVEEKDLRNTLHSVNPKAQLSLADSYGTAGGQHATPVNALGKTAEREDSSPTALSKNSLREGSSCDQTRNHLPHVISGKRLSCEHQGQQHSLSRLRRTQWHWLRSRHHYFSDHTGSPDCY